MTRKTGLPPGTLVHVGERRVEKTSIAIIDYSATEVNERPVASPEACREYLDRSSATWINVVGLHDTDILQRFGGIFDIHPLLLADILNTTQRPKAEDLENYLFLSLKMLYQTPDEREIVAEQVSLLLGRHYVLSFQEVEGDVFDLIRDRIRTEKGRIRKMGCDYLAYSLLDAIVDNYFVVLEHFGERIDELQEEVVRQPTPETLQTIHQLKSEMVFIRKSVWPLRELVSVLNRSESELIQESTRPYLRDLYEHSVQAIDNVESLRELLSNAMDIYLSSLSNRLNEVMRVLTVIATFFIPLTFIVGVYGMNFRHMPELGWKYGYAGIWAVMLAVVCGMAAFFKSKRWW